jgi:hypothetical protein
MMPKPPLDVAVSEGVLPAKEVVPLDPEPTPEDVNVNSQDANYDVKVNPDTGELEVTPKPIPEGQPPPPPFDPDVNYKWDKDKSTYIPEPKKTKGHDASPLVPSVPPPPTTLPAGASIDSGDWIGVVENAQFRWKWQPRSSEPEYAPENASAWGGYKWVSPKQSFDKQGNLITTEPGHWSWFERAGQQNSTDPSKPPQIIWHDKENNRYVVLPENGRELKERTRRNASDDMLPAVWGQSLYNVDEFGDAINGKDENVTFWEHLGVIATGGILLAANDDIAKRYSRNVVKWAETNGIDVGVLRGEATSFTEGLDALVKLEWGVLGGAGIDASDTWGQVGAQILRSGLLIVPAAAAAPGGIAAGLTNVGLNVSVDVATVVADSIATWGNKRENFDKFKDLTLNIALAVAGGVIMTKMRSGARNVARKTLESITRGGETVAIRETARRGARRVIATAGGALRREAGTALENISQRGRQIIAEEARATGVRLRNRAITSIATEGRGAFRNVGRNVWNAVRSETRTMGGNVYRRVGQVAREEAQAAGGRLRQSARQASREIIEKIKRSALSPIGRARVLSSLGYDANMIARTAGVPRTVAETIRDTMEAATQKVKGWFTRADIPRPSVYERLPQGDLLASSSRLSGGAVVTVKPQPRFNASGYLDSIFGASRAGERRLERLAAQSGQPTFWSPRPAKLPDLPKFKPVAPLRGMPSIGERRALSARGAREVKAIFDKANTLKAQRLKYVEFPRIAREAASIARNRSLRRRASVVGLPVFKGDIAY